MTASQMDPGEWRAFFDRLQKSVSASTDFYTTSAEIVTSLVECFADGAAIVLRSPSGSTGTIASSTSGELPNPQQAAADLTELSRCRDSEQNQRLVSAQVHRLPPESQFGFRILAEFRGGRTSGSLVVARKQDAEPFSEREILRIDALVAGLGGALARLVDSPLPHLEESVSEWTFHRIFDVSPLLLAITELSTGRFVEVNETFVDATGFARTELLGRTPVEIELWVTPQQRSQSLDELRAGELIRSREMQLRVKDGSIRSCLLSAAMIEYQGVPAVLSALVDVTERIRAESVLLRYELLAENSRDAFIFFDDHGKVIDVNAGGYAMYGYSPEQFLSLHAEDLRAIEANNLPEHPFESVLRDGGQFESIHRRSNGTTFPVEVVAQPGHLPGNRLVFSIIRDVSERVAAEAALRQSEERFRALIESLPQLVWTCNPDGLCDFLSRQWIDYTGIPIENQLGYRWLDVVHPDDKPQLLDRWNHSVVSGQTFDCEFRIRRNDGVFRWFKTRAVSVKNEFNHIEKWFGSNTDIEDLKQLESRRRELIDVLAHDLNNPLTAIKAQAQVLQRRLLRGIEIGPSQLEVISSNATRMANLISEMSDASKLSSGQDLELELAETDLTRLLSTVVESYRPQSTIHSIDFTACVEQVIGEWDGARLERVFANLLANAIKYSPQGGAIKITMSRLTTDDKPFIAVSIVDQGIGIPETDLHHIFEHNRRGGNVGRIQGNGIGLAGASDIIRLHGGRIEVVSEEGKGSTFKVLLPLSRPA